MTVQARPNIVIIMADDFSMNLMPKKKGGIPGYMPNLQRMMRQGMIMGNYFVNNSLCCPSRASLLTGKLPHNTHVLTNLAPEGGMFAFAANKNELTTFAIPLQAAGYKTGFMGKYLNGYDEESTPIPPGWDDWVSTSNGYRSFGYTANHNGELSAPPEHFTDYIANMGKNFLRRARGNFFLELTPFSPHGPSIPPARYDNSFLGTPYPITPQYAAAADANAPEWLKIIPPMRKFVRDRMAEVYIRRLQSSQGVDDLIGVVRRNLAANGQADNTYVIFTSDNGFHMGERNLGSGKNGPFVTDIRVPFVIVGPGIEPGSRSNVMAMNSDLYATFLDMAGLEIPNSTDGHSLLPAFLGQTMPPRRMTVVEYTRALPNPDDPDVTNPRSGNPPSYIALRFTDALYVEYETGEKSYYDMTTDPDQLRNIVGTFTPEQLYGLHAVAEANRICTGQFACGAAQAQ